MEKPLTEQCSSLLNQISSHPLFSILITFFLLGLLYLPNLLLPLLFSPVLITTSFLLTTLLHFGSPKPETTPNDTDPIKIQLDIPCEPTHMEFHEQKTGDIFCPTHTLIEWGRKGDPLEVIHEEYEGEEDEADSPEYSPSPEYSLTTTSDTNRLDCSGYHSSTESEDGDGSSENICFRWDEDAEGMIEIALEEDNLIEIDLTACRQATASRITKTQTARFARIFNICLVASKCNVGAWLGGVAMDSSKGHVYTRRPEGAERL